MTTDAGLLPPSTDRTALRRPAYVLRFVEALVVGLVATVVLASAAVLAYDASHEGRVLRGVRVGSVDLSGLDREQAAAALVSAYGSYGDGRLVIRTDAGDVSIPYADISRRPDTEAMIDDAMQAGRAGSPIERAVAEPRLALRGLELAPRVTLDETALASLVARALDRLERPPVDATISIDAAGIATTRAQPGRRFDAPTPVAAALETLRRPDAPAEIVVYASSIAVPPHRADAAVDSARQAAERIISSVVVTHGAATWTIPAETIRGWVRFEDGSDGSVGPVVEATDIPGALDAVAKALAREPVSARFLVGKDGATVGVAAGKDGQRLETAGTAASIATELVARAGGAQPRPVAATVVAVAPKLTTEDAQKVAPLMVKLSSWKTWFPISERNYWGANIWLPAKYIDGTVLEPGQTFEWFKAVGPITRARGFGPGGVIDGDHTDPTGAIGGGMCSSSTTLFNAALRAGLDTGARTNHSYWINRYPLGLDATITIKGGSTTTMTFTNDMEHPILIRGFKVVGSDGKGWVRYEIWGVPEGRTVSIGKPVVWNVRKATTYTYEVTTLPTGVRRQTEYPSNGMDVSVTRIVRDRDGHVLHKDSYRSHYLKWDGRIEVGV